jgi:hypothetical protein
VFEREALEEIEQFDRNPGCNGLLPINTLASIEHGSRPSQAAPPIDPPAKIKPEPLRETGPISRPFTPISAAI